MKSGPKAVSAEVRFWSGVEKTETCWLWGGKKYPNQYGTISLGVGQKALSTHRYSYMLHKGEIEPGLFICHKCDVKNCVNPDHLYAGTHEDNTKDIVDRERIANGKRVGPRIKTIRNNNRALHSTERERMISEYKAGLFTQTQLGKRYGISQGAVSATIRNWPNRKEDGGKKRVGHFRRKLSLEAAQEIVQSYATGKCTQTELAERFGVTQTHVSRLVQKATLSE
jgi:transposase-like protein